MKPYYDDGRGIVIYNADCREILPSLPQSDLMLTDPPYGLSGKLSGGNWSKKVGKSGVWDFLVKDMQLILDDATNSICFGGNYYPLRPSRCWFGWIKRDAVETCANLELAWTSFDAPSKYCDVTIAQTNAERCEHPTIKPLKLITWCIVAASKLADSTTIIDPFMGSGTTLRAAKDLGRKCIGIEIEERYCELAAKRLQQEVLSV